MDKAREALLNAFLCLSPETSHLRDIAYAKVILWVLFLEDGRPLKIDDIAKKGSELLQIDQLPIESIKTAVDILRGRRMVFVKDDLWSLVPSEKDNLEKTLKHSEEITNGILSRHFTKKIEQEVLKRWFNETNKEYFSSESEILLSLYNDGRRPVHHVDEIVKQVIKKFHLEQFENDLVQGYKDFLMSEEHDDVDRVFKFMSSLLSAKIVSAEISPEVFALDRYRNANVFLDTNVLFALTAYKNETIENALKAIGRSAKELKMNFYIADFTVKEYETVRIAERTTSIGLWNKYNYETLEGMDRKDMFSKGLIRTGCQTTQDVERFFDDGLKIPSRLGEINIKILKKEDVKEAEFDPVKDGLLFENIRNIFEEFTGRKKPENTAEHDVRLWKLAKSWTKSGNAFVLTIDQTMTTLALKEAGQKDDPLWQNLSGLIQVLALNGGGATYDPSDLAPLFRTFVDFDDITNKEKYDKRDLIILSEKTERIIEVPEGKVRAILRNVHKARLSNNPAMIHDAVLEIERTLRQNDVMKDQTIRERETTISELKSQLNQKGLDEKKSNKKVVWLCFIIKAIGALLLDYVLFFYLWDKLVYNFFAKENFEVVQILIQILAPLSYIFISFWKAIKSIRQIKNE